MFKVAFLLLVVIVVTEAIVCPPNYCERVDCSNDPTSCPAGQKLKKNGGFCGCCNKCVTQLGKGDNCAITFIRGSPPPAECKDGLNCNRKTDKCE